MYVIISFAHALRSGIRGYFNFRGRSSRSEFWYWKIFWFLSVWLVANLIHLSVFGFIRLIFIFVLLIPDLAIHVRRLHDINKSGWWVIPLIFLGPGMIWSSLGIINIMPSPFEYVTSIISAFFIVFLGPSSIMLLSILPIGLIIPPLSPELLITYLILGIILLGSILFMLWFCRKGDASVNRFGANPLDALRQRENFNQEA